MIPARAAGWFVALAVAMGAWMIVAPTSALAQRARGEVFVILASTDGNTMDPQLAQFPALRDRAFEMFHSMRLLERRPIQIDRGQSANVALPNGRQLRIEWTGVESDGRRRMRASINRPGETDYLPVVEISAAPGDPFFVAGQSHQGGTLIVCVKLA